jgi:hypothetical protein
MIRVPLLPAPGVNSNDTAFSSANRFTAATNTRFRNGKPEPLGGYVKALSGQLEGVCRTVTTWSDNDGYVNYAFGTHSHLFAYKGGTLADITPSSDFTEGAEHGAGGPGWGAGTWGSGTWGGASTDSYFPLTWSLANWGEDLIANPRMQGIFQWEGDTGTPAATLTNAPDQVIYTIVTPERQVLALGCTQVDTNFNPMCIRGSKTNDNTDWTPSPTTTAFEFVLEPGGGGRIVAGAVIGTYVAVWTDIGLYQGQYTGDPSNIYRFDLIDTGCGLVGPNAFQIHDGRAWWVTPEGNFYTWTPGELPSQVPCPISDDFRDHVATGQAEKIVACSISEYGEIWWSYPDSRDGNECSRAVFVSTQVPFGQPMPWSTSDFARSAMVDAKATRNPIMVSPDGYVYSHEDGKNADGAALSGSYTISLPNIEEGGRFVLIKGLEPDFKDQVGPLTMTLTLRKYPQSAGTTGSATVSIAPNSERKHFMASGRSGEVTFAWASSPAFHRAGKPVLLAEVTGRE